MDAAIRSYAENGEQGLTTKNLAKEAGCSEALIYRHFKSKDDLLCACYLRLHNKADASFEPLEFPENPTIPQAVQICRNYWIKVFKFFVDAGYESLFYFWFRMSDSFLDMLKEGSEELTKVYSSSFMNMFMEMRERFGLDITEDHYRTYIVFATGTFLNQVITGKLPATQESYEFMADLIFGGLMTTLPGVTLDKMAQIGNR